MTGNTGHPPPPLFLIITSVASLGTCAGGGEGFWGFDNFLRKNPTGKNMNCGDQGTQHFFTDLEKALKSLIK
jgi:hypothetical protein